MTTATSARPRGVEPVGLDRAVTRLAVAMLDWARGNAERKALRCLPATHEKMGMMLENERAIARTAIHPSFLL